jgi:archaellum component FlaC
MTEKPSEVPSMPTLNVRIKHDKPIESKVLGDILCAFSNEFILLGSRNGNRNEVLCVKEISSGSTILNFIIENINNIIEIGNNVIPNVHDIIDIGNKLLTMFFETLREGHSEFLKQIAEYVLIYNLQFEIKIISNNITINNNTFNIASSEAKKILANKGLKNGFKEQLGALENKLAELEYELLMLKKQYKLISSLFYQTQNNNCDTSSTN